MEGVDEAGGLWILCHSGQCSRHVQGREVGGGGELEGGGARGRVGGGVGSAGSYGAKTRVYPLLAGTC